VDIASVGASVAAKLGCAVILLCTRVYFVCGIDESATGHRHIEASINVQDAGKHLLTTGVVDEVASEHCDRSSIDDERCTGKREFPTIRDHGIQATRLASGERAALKDKVA
jgi:hypothetical protein